MAFLHIQFNVQIKLKLHFYLINFITEINLLSHHNSPGKIIFNLELIAPGGFSTLNVSMIPQEHDTTNLNKSVVVLYV